MIVILNISSQGRLILWMINQHKINAISASYQTHIGNSVSEFLVLFYVVLQVKTRYK
jgi:hypothetical protein